MGPQHTAYNISKFSDHGENWFLAHGTSAMQGARMCMGSRFISRYDIDLARDRRQDRKVRRQLLCDPPPFSFFGVFDGAQSRGVARRYPSTPGPNLPVKLDEDSPLDDIPKELLERLVRDERERLLEVGSGGRLFDCNDSVIESFIATDEAQTREERERVDTEDALLKGDYEPTEQIRTSTWGTTCTSVAVWVSSAGVAQIICMNAGHSRCVLSDCGEVTQLSTDHRPVDESEAARIRKTGSFIEFGRINGTMALSRGFGFLGYKLKPGLGPRDQDVTCCPEICRRSVSLVLDSSANDVSPSSAKKKSQRTFLVLACDGVWDIMTNEELCEFVEERLEQQELGTYEALRWEQIPPMYAHPADNRIDVPPEFPIDPEWRHEKGACDLNAICEDLIDTSVLMFTSLDNCTATVILFKKFPQDGEWEGRLGIISEMCLLSVQVILSQGCPLLKCSRVFFLEAFES